MDELTLPFLGPKRAALQHPFGNLLRTEAPLATGSDRQAGNPDPIAGIHIAVNRVLPGGTASRSRPDGP
ncbi:hypothetical protein [Actinomadura sp. BRA 177]|uniref:hypothetical protein n=1 Tax=Actinomadura sp. BRA 177 TaxID=2745202 RepID=UPI0015957033|nr:hypothetical protein [Actinomadura sp. BRA 177]NVI92804.1 hypothetical protein [Actinomadura sp. BRA 177]